MKKRIATWFKIRLVIPTHIAVEWIYPFLIHFTHSGVIILTTETILEFPFLTSKTCGNPILSHNVIKYRSYDITMIMYKVIKSSWLVQSAYIRKLVFSANVGEFCTLSLYLPFHYCTFIPFGAFFNTSHWSSLHFAVCNEMLWLYKKNLNCTAKLLQ